MERVTLFDIERNSYVDGPGIRTTVFFKGCNLRCAWCHNPESQLEKRQLMVYKNKCTGCGKCKEKCPNALETCDLCGKCELYCPHDARSICGKEMTVDEIVREVVKDKCFYDNSGGGVTLSGGECMLHADFVAALLKACRAEGIQTAIDTAGHVPYESFETVLPYTDLFLYDVKCFDSEKHRHYTDVGNERILENLGRLLESGKRIWVRIPVIRSVNNTVDEMEKIKAFLASHGMPERVELLPYHAMGEHKYAALGKEATKFLPPDDATMAKLRAVFC